MGASPAVVIVVRHGARLDASDKQWHLTSPTPYDPPLTYGGWTQSRSLGARIASILRSRETDNAPQSVGSVPEKYGADGRRRRHRIIIHTSPFLRCVQTAIAISSGLAQNPGPSNRTRPMSSHSARSSSFYASPRLRPTLEIESPMLAAIHEPPSPSKTTGKVDDIQQNIKKSTLRVDAFLGEWLTPDYFELITPPPSSVMMVSGAKADLLRREDYGNLIHVRETPSSTTFQGFPGGWGSPVVAAVSDQEDAPLPSLSSLAQALPKRDRTSSLGSSGSSGSRHSGKMLSKMSTSHPADHGVYQPPVPLYAIPNSEAIPAGYVAHARDACVTVDYQWDSMREPHNWGSGGDYGEEWSSMHKRFRKGLLQLIQYYEDQDSSNKLETKLNGGGEAASGDCAIQDDDDADLVIILVTHGAGCNALIGALTNQPVLLDVGMASLTMAVRKTTPRSTPISSPDTPNSHSRQASRTITISEEFDVKLVANTEHLRPSTNNTPTSSRAPSLAGIPIARPFGGPNGTATFIDHDRSRSVGTTSSNFGSIRRTASAVATPLSRTYTPGKATSIGLWSAPKPVDDDAVEEPGDDMVLNFGDDGAREPPKLEQPNATEPHAEEDNNTTPLGGLWGASKPTGDVEIVREMAPKRRWTVNEPGIV